MEGKVIIDGSLSRRVLLGNGESFQISEEDLPNSLRGGGDANIVLVPTGEGVDNAQARELLNYLLRID